MLSLNSDDKKKLTNFVGLASSRLAQIKELQDEIKELCADAEEAIGVKSKVLRQLAKERNWNDAERAEQQRLEADLDVCRLALGMLADTPLGEAAQGKVKAKKPTHPAAHA